jgi:ribose transport system ATP-binding protein
VLLVSSDLPEVLHLSNRLYVMHRGRIQAGLTGVDINEETVLRYFFQREAA